MRKPDEFAEAASAYVNAKAPTWKFIDPTTLQGQCVPEREWLVDQWISPGNVTSVVAPGGEGKTQLGQQALTSLATGKPWCGLAVSRCRTIGLFCEDDPDELHRRQDRINRAYGIDFDDLDEMTWASGIGEDNTLAQLMPDGSVAETPAFDALYTRALNFKARLIVIDTAADCFGGNENDRRQVRHFIAAILGKLARDLQAAVILNCHPSRTGTKENGDMDGASTAWSNTVRSRWSLSRPPSEGGVESPKDERILTRRKSNYAAPGDTIRLRWERGVLVPIAAACGLAGMARDQQVGAVFLDLLAKADEANMPVSGSKNSPHNFAPKVFAGNPARQGFGAKDFEAAMQRLLNDGKIKLQNYGRKNDERRRLAVVKENQKEGVDA